jgi:glycosyltransferase involved in cell wall biosynthesis
VTAPRVLQVVLRLDPGGTERLVIELVRRLHARLAMAVCCLDAPGAWADRVTALGVPVVTLSRPPGFHPGLAWRLARTAGAIGANVLHCHHYSPFIYGRLASWLTRGVRAVYTEHGRLSDAPPSIKRTLANRLMMAGAPDLYAVSHDLRAHLLREAVPARMRVIWNGIDPGDRPTPDARQAARARLGVSDDAFVIGAVARLDPVKDLGTLVDAVATAARSQPRVQLAIVGDGPERERLDDVIGRTGAAPHVRLLGHRDDVRALLPGFDLFANSSTSEGISLTLLEAMAAELPIVATRVGGTPEVVVDGETGRLVPARDAGAFAAALLETFADPARARSWGLAGRRRLLEHFTIDEMVRRYEAVYRDVASRGAR